MSIGERNWSVGDRGADLGSRQGGIEGKGKPLEGGKREGRKDGDGERWGL